MIIKSLIVSIISYFLFYFLILIFQPKGDDVEYFIQSALYGFILCLIPIVGSIFILLLLFNWRVKKYIPQKSKKQKEVFYFYCSIIISFIPVLGFAIFDYTRFNQFGQKEYIVNIFLKYSSFLILSFIVCIINRTLVWKNFPNSN